MATGSELSIERVTRRTNLQSLSELARICYGLDYDDAYFQWKYFENPAGDVIAYVAKHGEQVVSFYGVIPEKYMINHLPTLVYQSMDTMTHPDFRRKGLFVKLAGLCFDEVDRTQPGNVIIGFPSAMSYPGFVKKLGFRHLFDFKLRFRHRAFFPGIRTFSAPRLSFRETRELLPELSAFLSTAEFTRPIEKYFDEAVFQWKVFGNHARDIRTICLYDHNELVGYVLYYEDTPYSCYILDIRLVKTHFTPARLREIFRFLFRHTGKRWIYCWENENPAKKKILAKSGLKRNPFNFGPFHRKHPFIARFSFKSPPETWYKSKNYDFDGIMLD